jgi:tetratricopeptide (TPR) repeat protein
MPLNPVERRLVDLRNHWEQFRTDTSKRLLLWQAPDNATRLLHCFFEIQKHETEYTSDDLFIVFDSPFENSIQYSRAVKEALAGQYDASRQDLEREDISSDWRFAPEEHPDSARGFIHGLRSFASKYEGVVSHVVAVMMPSMVESDAAYCAWLLRALDAHIPERLRLVVIDSSEAPRLNLLAESNDDLLKIDQLNIDAMTTAQETFSQEPVVGPAGVFRNLLMALVALVEKGTVVQVRSKAADASAFARLYAWTDQETVIGMLVAGALLKEKRFDEAIEAYQNGRRMATSLAASGHPAGGQLVLQNWFGEGGARLASGDNARAAESYDQAAVVAEGIPAVGLAIEALRMSAFCYSRIDRFDDALDGGAKALRLGAQLPAEERLATTLPIVAFDVLRLLDQERVTQMERIKHELDADVDQLKEAAEQQAAAAEHLHDPQHFRAIEETLARDIAGATKENADAFDALVAAGGKQFTESFEKARVLLGKEWPLTNPIAIPRAPSDRQSLNAEGVTAT